MAMTAKEMIEVLSRVDPDARIVYWKEQEGDKVYKAYVDDAEVNHPEEVLLIPEGY